MAKIEKIITDWLDKKADQIRATDPNRILVSDISAFFGIPNILARLLCEMAVEEGYFDKVKITDKDNNTVIFFQLKPSNGTPKNK